MSKAAGIVQVGSLILHADRWETWWNAIPVPRLTRLEFLLVEALATRPGVERDRRYILDALGYADDADPRGIDQLVRRVRRKFEIVDPAFDAIQAVYAIGYIWRS